MGKFLNMDIPKMKIRSDTFNAFKQKAYPRMKTCKCISCGSLFEAINPREKLCKDCIRKKQKHIV